MGHGKLGGNTGGFWQEINKKRFMTVPALRSELGDESLS